MNLEETQVAKAHLKDITSIMFSKYSLAIISVDMSYSVSSFLNSNNKYHYNLIR